MATSPCVVAYFSHEGDKGVPYVHRVLYIQWLGIVSYFGITNKMTIDIMEEYKGTKERTQDIHSTIEIWWT